MNFFIQMNFNLLQALRNLLTCFKGGMLQKQGRPPSIPKSPTIDEDDTNKENLDTKSSEGNVVLRVKSSISVTLVFFYNLSDSS